MKKTLLILAIVAVIACVLCLILALMFRSSYYNLLDGTPEHYEKLHQQMVIFFTSGGISAVIGAVCFIIRSKI